MVPRRAELRERTRARDDRIAAFYGEGLTLEQVSRALRTSKDTARMVLKERGVAVRRKTDEKPELKARNDAIVAAYARGVPLARIAADAMLSVDGVIFILKLRGVARDRAENQRRANRRRDLKIAAAYRKGMTIRQAGAEAGLGFGGARDALIRLKVPIRTSGLGRKLPEQARWRKMRKRIGAAAELYTVKGLTTAEIGERLGMQAHTVAKNLKRMGVRIRTGKSGLTPEQVQRIRDQLVNKHATPQILAREYGMSESAVRDIGTGASWGHVPWRGAKRYVPKSHVKLNGRDVREIKRLLAGGKATDGAIRARFGISGGMLKHIRTGSTWKSIPWPAGTRLPLKDRRGLGLTGRWSR